MKRIYTGTGDGGETHLTSGGRVSKTDPRVAAAGALDESASALGLARALSSDERVQGSLLQAQEDVLAASAEVLTAVPDGPDARRTPRVTPEMTAALEREIDSLPKPLPGLAHFHGPPSRPEAGRAYGTAARVRDAGVGRGPFPDAVQDRHDRDPV